MKTISSTWTWDASSIGIFATTIGISKSRLRWRIFIMVYIKNMIKIMKIIIRRGGGGGGRGGEGGRTSRLWWQNFIISSVISYDVGDASWQYNDYKIPPPQSGCAPPLPLPSPTSPDNDFYDFYHTFDANYYKNPPPQSGFWLSRLWWQKSRLSWHPRFRWRRWFSIVYITQHPPPPLLHHYHSPHPLHRTVMYTIKYSMGGGGREGECQGRTIFWLTRLELELPWGITAPDLSASSVTLQSPSFAKI